jgi:sialidase-1
VPALLLGLAAPAAFAEPFLDKTDLFEAGKGGYTLYRIPGIVATKSGALLAYCEARKGTGSDWSMIDILMRRSTDGGKTWSEPQKIAQVDGPNRKNPAAVAQKLVKDDDVTYNNPVAIADRKTGAVHFLFCMEYMRCFYERSDDDGRTFSKPIEITAALEQFRKDYAWQAMATGPAHGVQLDSGRLLVPVWLSRATGGNAHRPSAVATIFSDDAGKTWQRSDIVAIDAIPLINPNETVAVELADGRVMLNMRNESKEHRRSIALSPDGATRWTAPAFDEQLKEPICMASICRYSKKPAAERNRLLFANPDNLERAAGKPVPGQNRDRKNLTVRLSEDEGKAGRWRGRWSRA